MDAPSTNCTAFDGDRQIASGPRASVAVAIKTLLARRPEACVLIFDDATGKQIDFDLRGTDAEIAPGSVNRALRLRAAPAARGSAWSPAK